jgi:RNA-directed DNA polymerase
LQTAPQAQVIAELNPLILGWATYYAGVVEASTMSRYDDLMEQWLINWASKRHPGATRDWLLSRYWQRIGNHRRVFATPDGAELRTYHTNLRSERGSFSAAEASSAAKTRVRPRLDV